MNNIMDACFKIVANLFQPLVIEVLFIDVIY